MTRDLILLSHIRKSSLFVVSYARWDTMEVVYPASTRALYLQRNSRGYNWATLLLGDMNTEIWPSSLGSLKIEAVK
jgi:hypothetical protein